MQRRRRYRMHKLNRGNKQQTKFDAHLHRESRRARTPNIKLTPDEKTTTQHEVPRQNQPAPSENMRATWRRSFRHGLMHLRRANPGTHQTQVGWVMAQLSRSLTDNPYMAEEDIESLVDSLVASAPEYETGEEQS